MNAAGVEEQAARGAVPAGWTPVGWAARLAYLAGRCAADHPALAATYRRWAETIEAREAQRREREEDTVRLLERRLAARRRGDSAER